MNISDGLSLTRFDFAFARRTASLVLALSLLGGCTLRADLLINENFKEGKVHWKGDVQDLPAPLGQNAPSGGLIKLKKDSWTHIYQVYKSPGKPTTCSITYQLSADFKLSGVETYLVDWGSMPGDRFFLAVNQGGGSSGNSIEVSKERSVPVTCTQSISKAGEVAVRFCIPPGEGSITFTNFSVTADK